ncbi:hypothetical protein MGSAQ_002053 [marine sediment metagenome]|uniref:Uncharacterized protein n=1 Tax=marine sediment metagenome TaxID=412755 RepID=A0A1B6NT10_9ZZZZ
MLLTITVSVSKYVLCLRATPFSAPFWFKPVARMSAKR